MTKMPPVISSIRLKSLKELGHSKLDTIKKKTVVKKNSSKKNSKKNCGIHMWTNVQRIFYIVESPGPSESLKPGKSFNMCSRPTIICLLVYPVRDVYHHIWERNWLSFSRRCRSYQFPLGKVVSFKYPGGTLDVMWLITLLKNLSWCKFDFHRCSKSYIM